MPRLSKAAKKLWSFFLNPVTGRRNYNPICVCCCQTCKQSYRAKLIECPRYVSKVAKKRKSGP